MALLTVETVAAYAAKQLEALGAESPFPQGAELTAREITGGNLNYAFCVEAKGGPSVFVKQAPDFIKFLGPEAKLHRERMELEVAAYKEWAAALGEQVSARYLPKIYAFDTESMTFVMEFLGSYQLLMQSLFEGVANEAVAAGMGEVMGAMHAKTHCTKVPAGEAERLTKAFQNSELRGVQLQYVFTKAFQEAKAAEDLRKDESFMAELDGLKAKYRGENAADLALAHGDLHPGSVMADSSVGAVKIIDPEFAIYGPPGIDVGSLLSGYTLACIYLAMTGSDRAGLAISAASKVWTAYVAAMEANAISADIIAGIGEDAVGFASCEVARTALGFAGARGLPVEDEALKAEADKQALALAYRCIMGRKGKGVPLLISELEKLGKNKSKAAPASQCALL